MVSYFTSNLRGSFACNGLGLHGRPVVCLASPYGKLKRVMIVVIGGESSESTSRGNSVCSDIPEARPSICLRSCRSFRCFAAAAVLSK